MRQDISFIFNPNRWNILEAISQGHTSATTIAKKLNISLAYIAQQLKLLEAYHYLKKEPPTTQTVGKPQTHYKITKDLILLAAINEKKVGMNVFKPPKRTQFLINTLFQNNELELYFLQKFYYLYESFIHSTQLVALTEINPHEIHFLIITTNVEEARKKYSNIVLKNAEGAERKIVIWSHNLEEVNIGLQNNEQYYLEKISKAQPYWEKDVSLEELRELQGGKHHE